MPGSQAEIDLLPEVTVNTVLVTWQANGLTRFERGEGNWVGM